MVKPYRLYLLLLAPLSLVGCADDDDALYGPAPGSPSRLAPQPQQQQYAQNPPSEAVPPPGGDSVPGPDMGTPPPPDGGPIPQPSGPPPGALAQGPGPSGPSEVYAPPGPPPPPQAEFVPRRPYRAAIWVPGHWVWAGNHWAWVHGFYRRRAVYY